MKNIAFLLLILTVLSLSASRQNQLIVEKESTSQSKYHEGEDEIRWDYFSAISGVVGLGIAFIPYLSLIGVLLGVSAVVFSILAFRKKQKKRWALLGMITGGLTILALFTVIGLITFF
jgi:hypothetical protein